MATIIMTSCLIIIAFILLEFNFINIYTNYNSLDIKCNLVLKKIYLFLNIIIFIYRINCI